MIHFCATLTCEHKEMGYDGMRFHRVVSLDWKQKLNTITCNCSLSIFLIYILKLVKEILLI